MVMKQFIIFIILVKTDQVKAKITTQSKKNSECGSVSWVKKTSCCYTKRKYCEIKSKRKDSQGNEVVSAYFDKKLQTGR